MVTLYLKKSREQPRFLAFLSKALEKNKTYIGQRYINVAMASGERQQKPQQTQPPPADCRTVFVKGLPYSITSEEIGDAFRHCGVIENVRMVFNTVN
jgi:RNA recognition motif-containing protein